MKAKNSPSEYLEIPLLKLGDINSRLLNHWEKENIIFDNRPGGKGWRKYSLKDKLWIKIVEHLREFNFPLNSLKKLRKEFYDSGASYYPSILEKILNHFLSERESMELHVYSTGKINLFEQGKKYNNSDNYIRLNVDSIIKEVLPDIIDIPNPTNKKLNLTPEEEKLYKLIRSGIFKKIEVELEDGKIKQLNAEQIIKDMVLFNELAKEFPYQDIVTVIRNGKPFVSKRTIKLRQ
ncbi:MerR family transcriptional regulator [Flagellimonas marinaquae]